MLNVIFQISKPLDPKPCLLGILDDFQLTVHIGEPVARAPFQARRVLFRYWKTERVYSDWKTNVPAQGLPPQI